MTRDECLAELRFEERDARLGKWATFVAGIAVGLLLAVLLGAV